MQEDIIYLKLITGEDIVTYVDTANEEYVSIHKPVQFFMHNTTKGAVIRSAKWIPFSDEIDLVLRTKDIVLSLKPTNDILNYYLETVVILDQRDGLTEEREYNSIYSNTNITVH
jgi:hypothetical protein